MMVTTRYNYTHLIEYFSTTIPTELSWILKVSKYIPWYTVENFHQFWSLTTFLMMCVAVVRPSILWYSSWSSRSSRVAGRRVSRWGETWGWLSCLTHHTIACFSAGWSFHFSLVRLVLSRVKTCFITPLLSSPLPTSSSTHLTHPHTLAKQFNTSTCTVMMMMIIWSQIKACGLEVVTFG